MREALKMSRIIAPNEQEVGGRVECELGGYHELFEEPWTTSQYL